MGLGLEKPTVDRRKEWIVGLAGNTRGEKEPSGAKMFGGNCILVCGAGVCRFLGLRDSSVISCAFITDRWDSLWRSRTFPSEDLIFRTVRSEKVLLPQAVPAFGVSATTLNFLIVISDSIFTAAHTLVFDLQSAEGGTALGAKRESARTLRTFRRIETARGRRRGGDKELPRVSTGGGSALRRVLCWEK